MMDSEYLIFKFRTSFEGYRNDGPKFLTMESEEENPLDRFSVKDFMSSKPMSKVMIEHFMSSLNPNQIQLVDQLIAFRKRSMTSKKKKK